MTESRLRSIIREETQRVNEAKDKAAAYIRELKGVVEQADRLLNRLQQTEAFSTYPTRDRMRTMSKAIAKLESEVYKAENDL